MNVKTLVSVMLGVLTTLIHALRRRGQKRGIATLCLGGGNGVAMAVELV